MTTLVVGPNWVGDMVMAQSLFKVLLSSYENANIDVLAPAWTLPLLARMPEVRQSHVAPFAHGQLALAKRWQLGRKLRSYQYDQAIIIPGSWKSAVVPWAAAIPKRTGWLREQRWGLLNDIRFLDKLRYPTMVERLVALAYPAKEKLPVPSPSPSLQINAVLVENAMRLFNLSMSDGPVLALCPGAEYGPAKRWPAQHFASIAKTKLDEGFQVWIFGSAKDHDVAAEINILTQNRCVNLAGETELSQAVDLLSLASVVVTNDSGLMHVACALDRKVVAVYGSSSTHFTPPLSNKAEVVKLDLECSPCFKRECPLRHLNCLMQLSPKIVLDKLK